MAVRLIDESTLQRVLFCQIQKNAIDSGSAHYDGYKSWCLSGLEVEKAINDIFSETSPFAPTIDPETLPIVRELREKVSRLEEARENANEACGKWERKCCDLEKQLADVEPVKRAEWAWYPDYRDRHELHCTNCEEECPYDADGKYLDAKFCPHCGAVMVEE